MVIPVSKPKVSPTEKKYRQETFPDVKEIKNKNLLCTSCGGSVKDPISKGKPIIHPFLETLLCEKCHLFYGDGQFSVDEDGSDKYCRWCGQGGTLFLCSKCTSGFCKRCVKRNLPKSEQAKIEDDDWVCYCCDTAPLYELRAQCWAAQQYAVELVKNKASSKNKKSTRESSKRSLELISSGSDEEVQSKKKLIKEGNGGGDGGGRLLRKRDRKSQCSVKPESGSDFEDLELSPGKILPSGISVDRIHAALNKLSSFVVDIAGMTKETHKKLLECKNKKINMKNINSLESVCDIQGKLSSMMVSLETNVQMVRKGLEGYVGEWCNMVKDDLKAKDKEGKGNEKVDIERLENGLPSESKDDNMEAEKKMEEAMEVDKTEEEKHSSLDNQSNVEEKSADDEKSPSKDDNSGTDENQAVDIKESSGDKSEERIRPTEEEEEDEESNKNSDGKLQAEDSNTTTKMVETTVPSSEEAPSPEIISSTNDTEISIKES